MYILLRGHLLGTLIHCIYYSLGWLSHFTHLRCICPISWWAFLWVWSRRRIRFSEPPVSLCLLHWKMTTLRYNILQYFLVHPTALSSRKCSCVWISTRLDGLQRVKRLKKIGPERLFTRSDTISDPVPITVKFYNYANGDRPSDRLNGCGTYSAHQTARHY